MARGQLLTLLQSVARRARSAEACDETSRHAPPAVDGRRRLLTQAMVGSAWAMSAPMLQAAALRNAPRVIVIGAGLAGLSAATDLVAAGCDVTVHEGSPRIGGRCISERHAFADGQVAERGGELIDSTHVQMRTLVAALGLELDDLTAAEAPGTQAIVRLADGLYPLADIERDFRALLPALDGDARALGDDLPTCHRATPAQQALDRLSASDWITTRVSGGMASRLGRLIGNAYVEELGGDLYETNAVTVVALLRGSPRERFSPYEESDQRYHVRGGNDQVPRLLAQRLGARVQTSSRLVALARTSDGRMRVVTARDQVVHEHVADRVVLALPFTLLREVDFARAAFSPRKQRAIRELGMGRNCKLQLQFDERAWVALGATGETRMQGAFETSWEVTRAQAGRAGIINCFSGGSTATVAGEGELDERARDALATLELALPGITQHWNGRGIRNAWGRYPWTLGSYALFKPGQYTTLNGCLHEPEGRVHFAGEHTSADWQGYLNGAVESGRRAAKEVVAKVNLHRKAA